MIHTKWHFQLHIQRKGTPECYEMAFDSQNSKVELVAQGFCTQIQAFNEANKYLNTLLKNPMIQESIVKGGIFTYQCRYSALPGDYELKEIIEIINALSVGKPRITHSLS